jgi:hypothetical protein
VVHISSSALSITILLMILSTQHLKYSLQFTRSGWSEDSNRGLGTGCLWQHGAQEVPLSLPYRFTGRFHTKDSH